MLVSVGWTRNHLKIGQQSKFKTVSNFFGTILDKVWNDTMQLDTILMSTGKDGEKDKKLLVQN